MIDPVIKTALTASIPPTHGILRIAIYNCIMAGRVKDKPTAEIFVKALTDNKFVQREHRQLRQIIATIDLRCGAFGPDSSFWLDTPERYEETAARESARIRAALPNYTTNRTETKS